MPFARPRDFAIGETSQFNEALRELARSDRDRAPCKIELWDRHDGGARTGCHCSARPQFERALGDAALPAI